MDKFSHKSSLDGSFCDLNIAFYFQEGWKYFWPFDDQSLGLQQMQNKDSVMMYSKLQRLHRLASVNTLQNIN